MHLQCIAYKEDGTICREPATILGQQRGGMVCEAHDPAHAAMATCPDCGTRFLTETQD